MEERIPVDEVHSLVRYRGQWVLIGGNITEPENGIRMFISRVDEPEAVRSWAYGYLTLLNRSKESEPVWAGLMNAESVLVRAERVEAGNQDWLLAINHPERGTYLYWARPRMEPDRICAPFDDPERVEAWIDRHFATERSRFGG